jgi:hypothetical protein
MGIPANLTDKTAYAVKRRAGRPEKRFGHDAPFQDYLVSWKCSCHDKKVTMIMGDIGLAACPIDNSLLKMRCTLEGCTCEYK